MNADSMGWALFVDGDEWLADPEACWERVQTLLLEHIGDRRILAEPKRRVVPDEQRRGVTLYLDAKVAK